MRRLTDTEIEKINHTRIGCIVHLKDVDVIICESGRCVECIGYLDNHNCSRLFCLSNRRPKLVSDVIGGD